MRIVIYGSGGVGGNFGGYMARAGLDVTFIARGEHLRAMKERGLELQTPNGNVVVHPVKATDNPAEVGVADVVFHCLKAWQLEETADAMRPLIGPETMLIPLQNWVEAPAFLAARFSAEHVLGGVCYTVSSIVRPGVVHADGGRIIFGEMERPTSERAERLAQLLGGVPGITVINASDIRKQMWKKFVWISSVGALGASTGGSVGEWRRDAEKKELFKKILREAFAVAKAKGASLGFLTYWRTMRQLLGGQSDTLKTSMQRDMAQGVRSELDYQIGTIVRLGRQLNVSIPASEALYEALLSIESQAQAKTASAARRS
jgi:2-dehydropantoate 2-reductase